MNWIDDTVMKRKRRMWDKDLPDRHRSRESSSKPIFLLSCRHLGGILQNNKTIPSSKVTRNSTKKCKKIFIDQMHQYDASKQQFNINIKLGHNPGLPWLRIFKYCYENWNCIEKRVTKSITWKQRCSFYLFCLFAVVVVVSICFSGFFVVFVCCSYCFVVVFFQFSNFVSLSLFKRYELSEHNVPWVPHIVRT